MADMARSRTRQEFTIRAATADDAEQIASLHCESWRDAYANVLDPAYLAGPIEADRRAVWSSRLAEPSPQQTVLLAETAGHGFAGFVCLYRDHDERWGSLIDNLHVRPALRGRTMGEALLRAAVTKLGQDQAFHLWVFEANVAGIRFYQRLGGAITERTLDDMPAAQGAPILRMAWPNAASLRGRH